MRLLPTVTASENGRILLVANGNWVPGTAPTGLPTVTSANDAQVLTVVGGNWAAFPVQHRVPDDPSSDAIFIFDGTDRVWLPLPDADGFLTANADQSRLEWRDGKPYVPGQFIAPNDLAFNAIHHWLDRHWEGGDD